MGVQSSAQNNNMQQQVSISNASTLTTQQTVDYHQQHYPHCRYDINSTIISDLLDYEMLICMSNLTEMSDINVEQFFNNIENLLEKQKKIKKTKQNQNIQKKQQNKEKM